jgi:hypothetical protein
MSTPDAAVKKLARLPHNMTCPNCGTMKKFGFSSVCIKFLTFVCNDCKASHAAYSHRCKSLTMSTWSAEEVLQLKRAGNDVARRTWLARAPPPGVGKRPKEGDDINKFKAFIVDVYERKMFFSEDSGGGGGGGGPAVQTAVPLSGPVPRRRVPAPAPAPRRVEPAPAPPPPRPAPVPAPAPVADLLDFSAPAPAAKAPSNNFANFDAFSSQSPAAAPASTPVFDPFNNNPNSSTPATSTQSSIPAPAPAPPSMASSDPFAGMTSIGTNRNSNVPGAIGGDNNTGAPKKTIFNTGSSGNAGLISGMNTMASMATMQQQMGMQQQPMGGGMNFAGMQQQQQQPMGGMNTMNMMGQQQGGMNGMNTNTRNMNMNMMGQQGGMNGMNMMGQQGGMNGTNMMGMGGMGGMNNNMQQQPMGGMNSMGGMMGGQKAPMSMMGGSTNSISRSFGNKPAMQQSKPDPFADLKF